MKPRFRPKDRPRAGQRPQPRPQAPPARRPDGEVRLPKGRWVMGIHSVKEAIKVRPHAIAQLWLKEGSERHGELQEIISWARAKKIRTESRPASFLERFGSGHQGVMAQVTEDPKLDPEAWRRPGPQKILILDGIMDPHNLGAILRTAWLLGVSGVFIPEHRASPLTPTAMKVASGGAEHVPVIVEQALPQVMSELKEAGFWLYGLSSASRQNLWMTRFPEKVALVIGAEDRGLRTTLERACDELLLIPQVESEASFNASVACAIALGEVGRQHHSGPLR